MDAHAQRVLEFDRVRAMLAERAASDLGRNLALELEPRTDPAGIRLSLEQTGEAARLIGRGQGPPLAGLADVGAFVSSAHDDNRALEPRELHVLGVNLRLGERIRDHLAGLRDEAPTLAQLADRFLDLGDLAAAIEETIEAPGVVVDRASPRLWDLRKEIRRLEDELRETLDRLLKSPRLRGALQHENVTIRNGRWVLALKVDQKGRLPGILHGYSASGQTAFVEPTEGVTLSAALREQRHLEQREESRILWELTRRVFHRRHDVTHTANILAWIDLTVAKARMISELDHRIPEISPDGSLRLVSAHHPLLDETLGARGEKTVPLDVRLREGFRILVITGPNTGGKTVTLKTVGLLQLMFQAGMAVPVGEGSRMPVFTGVFADIGDEQSIQQSLSTFSGHVANIAEILRSADRRTLVLLDELGAGTDPAEGAALGSAILEELRDRHSAVIVTTHLGSLKEFALANPEAENACVEFDPATMKPLYRLLIGQPGNSNALAVGRRYGLPESIVERAGALVDRGPEGTREMMDGLMASRQALEEQRRLSEVHLRRSRNLEKAAEERQRHLDKRGRRVEREAERTIEDALRELLGRAEPHLRALKNVPKALRQDFEALDALLRDSVRGTSLASRRRQYLETLKKGDEVFVPRFEQACRIRKFLREQEKLVVMVGSLPMEIDYDDIALRDPAAG